MKQTLVSEPMAAIKLIAGWIAHRIEFPKLRTPPPNWKDSAKIIRGTIGENGKIKKGRKTDVFAIDDKQRLGFRERKLSVSDKEEIQGACALVFSEKSLWERDSLSLEDWKTLFRASRAVLRFDRRDGPGAKGRIESLEAQAQAGDFHAGLACGKSACDLDTFYVSGPAYLETAEKSKAERDGEARTEHANRVRFADMGRDFRRALVCAREASQRGREQALRDFRANHALLRFALSSVAGSGHGMTIKRRDGMAGRTLHGKIARFTEYLSAGFLAEACAEFSGDIYAIREAQAQISLTATANC